jgi:predicted glycoside hydrolase/deacetylase ChbG (UPF0249 family)
MRLVFVADDYGAGKEENCGAFLLAESGILGGVSVIGARLSVYPDKPARPENVRFGIHFFLTEFPPLTLKMQALCEGEGLTKKSLAWALLRGRISEEDVAREFDEQFDRVSASGFQIEFIDSHMNIHWWPIIFPAVMRVASRRGLSDSIRPCAQLNIGSAVGTLRGLFSRLIARVMRFKANSRVLVGCPGYRQENIDINLGLRVWDKFLSQSVPRGYEEVVVPCHPGVSPAELELYSSAEFVKILKKWDVR